MKNIRFFNIYNISNKILLAWLALGISPVYAESPDEVIARLSESGDPNMSSPIRFLLRPLKSTVLSAKTNGNITHLPLLPGTKFKQGELLIKQECSLVEAEQKIYEEDVKIQKVKYDTTAALIRKKSVGKLEHLINKYSYLKARAQVKAASAKSRQCKIKAPFGGVVSKVLAHKHEYVTEGTQIVEIFNDAAFELHMIVPSFWLKWLKPDHVFTVKIDETATSHKAEVKRIEPRIDSVSKTVPIVGVLIDEPTVKYYGMSGTAFFDVPEK